MAASVHELGVEERLDRLEAAVVVLVRNVNAAVHVRDDSGGPLVAIVEEHDAARRLADKQALEAKRASDLERVERERNAARRQKEILYSGGDR